MNTVDPYITNLDHRGFHLTLHTNDALSKNIIAGREWEPHLTDFVTLLLKTDDIVIDAGANFGYHTLYFAKLCPSGMIYTFEPQKQNYLLLERNVRQNNLNANVKLFYEALGNQNIKVRVPVIDITRPSNMGDISVKSETGLLVDCRKIDDLKLERLDFIKIDVQGYEKHVLEGGRETILKTSPIILIEIEDNQLRKFNYQTKELLILLKQLGYEHIYLLDYEYPADYICVTKNKHSDFLTKFGKYLQHRTEDTGLNQTLMLGVTEKIKITIRPI